MPACAVDAYGHLPWECSFADLAIERGSREARAGQDGFQANDAISVGHGGVFFMASHARLAKSTRCLSFPGRKVVADDHDVSIGGRCWRQAQRAKERGSGKGTSTPLVIGAIFYPSSSQHSED